VDASFIIFKTDPGFLNNNEGKIGSSKSELSDSDGLKFKDILTTTKGSGKSVKENEKTDYSTKASEEDPEENKILLEETFLEEEKDKEIITPLFFSNLVAFSPTGSDGLCRLKENEANVGDSYIRLEMPIVREEKQVLFGGNAEISLLDDFVLEENNTNMQMDLAFQLKKEEETQQNYDVFQWEEIGDNAKPQININTKQTLDVDKASDDIKHTAFKQIIEPQLKEIRKEIQVFSVNTALAEVVENNSEYQFKAEDDEVEFKKMAEGGQIFKESTRGNEFKIEQIEVHVPDKLNQETVDSILNQIIKQSRVFLKEGKSGLQIQLKPENLGRVTLQVLIEDDGVVSAKFAVENRAVKQALQDNLASLRQGLEQQGIVVDKLIVKVNEELTGFLGQSGFSMGQGSSESRNRKQYKFSQGKVEKVNDYNLVASVLEQVFVQEGLDFKA